MNRRSFFSRTIGVLVAGIAARYRPKGRPAPLHGMHVISATHTFWRNRPDVDSHGRLVGIATTNIPKDAYGWVEVR